MTLFAVQIEVFVGRYATNKQDAVGVVTGR